MRSAIVELAEQSIELARLVANNPNAPPEVLKTLRMSNVRTISPKFHIL
jgi:hypothetical protein